MDGNQSPNKDLQDRLNRLPHDWDTESLWVAIEKDLPRKRRPVLFWLFGGSILVATGLLVGYYFLSKTAIRPISSFPVSNQPVTVTKDTNVTVRPAEVIIVPKTAAKLAFERSTQPQKATPVGKNFNRESTSKASSIIINRPKLTERKPTLTSTPTTNLSLKSKALASKRADSGGLLPSLEVSSITPLQIPNLMPSFPRWQNLPVLEETPPNPRFSLLLYQGIGHVWTSFELKVAAQQSHLDRRLATERPLESWSTGLSATWQFNRHLFVEAGIERQQITTLLQGTIREETVRTVESDSAFYYTDVSGLRNYLAGEHTLSTITTRQLNHYNRTVLYNFPLAVGYQQRYGRIAFGVEGGVVFNWQQRFSGEIIMPDETLLSNESIQTTNLFSSNIGMGWQAGGHVQYRLCPQFDLQLTLWHRQFLGSLTEVANSGYQQQIRIVGVQIGIGKRF
ncbi:MAG: hypothetical protein AAGJ18_14020 [Bacteroidota bacterium]